MKSTLRVFFAVVIIAGIPFCWLRYDQSRQVSKIQKFLQSSPRWNHLQARKSVAWRTVVDGTVPSEKDLLDLRDNLRRINSKAAVVVRVDSNAQ